MAKRSANVLVVGPTPPPYHGVATFTRELLAARSPDFKFLHVDTSDRRDAGNFGRWDPRNVELGFANLADIASRSLRRRPRIVYVPISQNVPAFVRDALFALSARALGARIVLHLHGGYFRELYDAHRGALFRALAAALFRQTSAAVVLGENLRPLFRGLLPEARIHVVENGAPDPEAWELRRSARRRAFPRVLFMSTLDPEKGALDVLLAVKLLGARFPDIEARLAGAFPDARAEKDFYARACAAGLSLEDVRRACVGPLTGAEKSAFFASGDLFCLPTRYRYEGQPLVLLEALAAGLPVIATPHAAIPSTIEHGVTGTLTAPRPTPAALADAIAELLDSGERLRWMSHAAREAYAAKYTLAHCHARLFSVFRKVLAE
jgi:glycosyltransferase involved in cell wall biosynthesis